MAKSPAKPKKSKKNPARTPRSKAARPETPPTPDTLADLLNPAIAKGTAGVGSGTGQNPNLTPPPDNSWERRQDFSAAHTARKSARSKEGFGEAPQRAFEAPPVLGIDPQLAKELGLDADEAEFPSPLRGGVRGGGRFDGDRAIGLICSDLAINLLRLRAHGRAAGHGI
jgi:excinuclease ABC subunit B